jgi:hypothetical protein
MDWQMIMTETLKGLLIASIPALAAVIASLWGYLKAWIEAQTRNQWLIVIEREAFQVVAAVGQTIVVSLKEKAADGSLTAEECQYVKNKALETLKTRLSAIPRGLFPDIEKRMADAVEAAVPQAKAANPTQSPVQK